MTDSPSGFGSKRSRPAGHPYTLEVVPSDPAGPGGEYTFLPRDADEGERLTQWITADSDAVVELRTWR
ncbi:hypothetical protein [Natronomonas sp. LN261]|jgi:hypothetical protein|uniref:DUF7511 domain-containing protein n=1 Tax=Natronomonas sp. LN261 TaxID=2750669 RepID=UPI0015EFDA4E|nr:hypothetical protein [Natronomonas sp. LN261]